MVTLTALSGYRNREYVYQAGETFEASEELAAFLEADAPGVFKRLDAPAVDKMIGTPAVNKTIRRQRNG